MAKFKQFFIIILTVFIGALATQLLANVTNIFATDLSTWLIVLNSAVLSVITYAVAYLIPLNKEFGLGSK